MEKKIKELIKRRTKLIFEIGYIKSLKNPSFNQMRNASDVYPNEVRAIETKLRIAERFLKEKLRLIDVLEMKEEISSIKNLQEKIKKVLYGKNEK